MSAERWSDRIANRPCGLCGRSGLGVKVGLACWADGTCDAIPRCADDRDACRARCEAGGHPWPTGLIEPKVAPRAEVP